MHEKQPPSVKRQAAKATALFLDHAIERRDAKRGHYWVKQSVKWRNSHFKEISPVIYKYKHIFREIPTVMKRLGLLGNPGLHLAPKGTGEKVLKIIFEELEQQTTGDK